MTSPIDPGRLELHCWYCPGAFAGLKVWLGLEAGYSGPNTVGELANEGVVVLNKLVVAPAFLTDPILATLELGLKGDEVLVGLQVGVIFRDGEQSAQGAVELAVGRDLALRVAGVEQPGAGVGDVAEDGLFM